MAEKFEIIKKLNSFLLIDLAFVVVHNRFRMRVLLLLRVVFLR